MADPKSNPVGFLQEYAQKNGTSFPNYIEVMVSGLPHQKLFTYRCHYNGFTVEGAGSSKKEAKNTTAKKMIESLKEAEYFEGKRSKPSTASQSNMAIELNMCGEVLSKAGKNPISRLEEFCTHNFLPRPNYSDSVKLADENAEFLIECQLGDKKTYGTGLSKKLAKTESAQKMCLILNLGQQSNQIDDGLLSKCNDVTENQHPVSYLQEFCVHKGIEPPVYKEENDVSSGIGFFVVNCYVENITACGRHSSKKGAKMLAASNALEQLRTKNLDSAAQRESAGIPQQNGMVAEPRDDLPKSSSHKPAVLLEEFLVSKNEEDLEDQEGLKTNLQSLSLNDSLVEIDPGSDKRDNERTAKRSEVEREGPDSETLSI